MKKSCLFVLIGLFLFSGSCLAVKAWGLRSTGGTGGVKISNTVSPARTDVGSLPGALQSVLSQTLGANNPAYRVSRSGGVYRAVNGPNRLSATIGLDGFMVRAGANEWGLRLTAWGAGSSLQRIGAGRAVSGSNRVAIDRGGIVEWWVNGPLGIEQGWTVKNRPHRVENRGRLTLALRQSGDMRTQALSHGRSLSVWSNTGREVLRYTGLTAYDKNGRQLPAHFEATRQGVRVVVNDTGAAYPVRIDPWVEAAKLAASDGAADNYLGYSVAVSPDGATVVAGAPYAAVGSNSAQGAVYVFKGPASGWADGIETAKLTASDGKAGDELGYSVAVSPDGATIVAGAFNAAVGSNSAQGAVYVFNEPASGWADGTQTAKYTASGGDAGDDLGSSVAVSSEGATIVAGAEGAKVWNNNGQGAVYVFNESTSWWEYGTQQAQLTASDGAANNYFGSSVAVSPDGATVVAGAYNATVGSNSGQGAAYVFNEPASGWADGLQAAKLTASDGNPYDHMGWSVAVSPEGATIVAGAPYAAVGSNSAQGAVYEFNEPASGWAEGSQTAKLAASDGNSYDYLGWSVAVSSKGATVVAGAEGATVGSNIGQGAVYVFKEPASGWADGNEVAKLTASDGNSYDYLGWSVAMSQDGATVVAGAPYATVGGNSFQGAVYVFQGSFWQNATDLGNGWMWLNWFGYFYSGSSPWICHQTLGWLYPYATSTANIWCWDPQWDGQGGWWWTSSSVFPWIYSVTEGEWLYYDANATGGRWFFNGSGQASTH